MTDSWTTQLSSEKHIIIQAGYTRDIFTACDDAQYYGVRRIFQGVGKLGVWERKSSSGVQGWSPGGGPQKPTTGCENNAWIIRLLRVLLYLLMHENSLQHQAFVKNVVAGGVTGEQGVPSLPLSPPLP